MPKKSIKTPSSRRYAKQASDTLKRMTRARKEYTKSRDLSRSHGRSYRSEVKKLGKIASLYRKAARAHGLNSRITRSLKKRGDAANARADRAEKLSQVHARIAGKKKTEYNSLKKIRQRQLKKYRKASKASSRKRSR